MRSLYEKLNRLDDSLSEDVAYSYLVYAESGSTDEEGLFDDLRLAKKLAKKIAIKLSEKDPGAYVLIKRGIRGSDVVNDTWKVINRVKYDPKKDSFEFNTPQTPHPLYGMTNENLNEINNSLVESKRIIKNRKLTEGYRVDPKISEFNVGDRVAERYNDSEFNVGTIIDIKKDSEGTQYLVKWDYSDREYEEWLYGDVLSLWVEDETEDNYDDDIDEMLTETTSFKSGDRYYGGLPSEPSMSEYGKTMDAARKNREALLDKYNIKVDNDRSKGYTTYTGTINGHTFKYVEGQRDFSHWLSELIIDNKTVNPYKSSLDKISKMFETNAVSISNVIDLLLKDNFDNIVYKESLTEGGYDPYRAGKYGDLIFNILDNCSGDAIINFMYEYGWPFYKSGDSMSDVYDKINNYLDTHSGYGLWSDLADYFEETEYDDNIEEMLIETISGEDDTLKHSVSNNDLTRIDTEKLIDYRIRSAAKTGRCPICGGDLTNMVCDHCKNSYRQDGNNGTNYTLIDAALLRSIQKVDPSFSGLSLDEKVEYLYNSFFLGGAETATRNTSGNQIEKDAQRKNKISKLFGNSSYDTSGDNVRKTKQYIKQQLLQAAKLEDENTNALQKVKPEEYIKNNIVKKN